MCDFNTLSSEQKLQYQKELLDVANTFGSVNSFLQLLEEVRKTKPHPLVNKNNKFLFSRGAITWNKVIFQDKLTLLLSTRTTQSERHNFLLSEDDKAYKKVLNLVRTLAPISFTLKAKSGDGSYELKAFEKVDEVTTLLNPIFDAIFFCSIDTVKKILNYKE